MAEEQLVGHVDRIGRRVRLAIRAVEEALPGFIDGDRRVDAVAIVEQSHPADDVARVSHRAAKPRRKKADAGREHLARPGRQHRDDAASAAIAGVSSAIRGSPRRA